jgi:hypothetical protein
MEPGTTSKQMLDAPKGSVFIWYCGVLGYPIDLARHLGRTDLKIVSLHDLDDERLYAGRHLPGIVIDHTAALRITDRQFENLLAARRRVVTESTNVSDRPSV